MHDRLFDNQKALSKKAMIAMAASIGIDVERFSACMDSRDALDAVKADIDQGIKLGVRGTPTWFINGLQQVGATEPAEIVALAHQIQRELRAKGPAKAQPEDNKQQDISRRTAERETDWCRPSRILRILCPRRIQECTRCRRDDSNSNRWKWRVHHRILEPGTS